ncbi:MAG: hypothetical protein JNL58_01555 [Planctomyces sp.]|nr:hypothetical protein [Planctomyces sp.]
MAGSANVTSLDAVCNFTAALIAFHSEASLCLTAMDAQLRQIQLWLERDRPVFWKREVEDCTRNVSEARIRLHQCRMRRVGDFRPTCFEEQKDLEQAKRNLDFAQHQVPTVKHWLIATGHEANEFHGRASQLVQFLHRDIPHLMSILKTTIERISSYAAIEAPAGHVNLSAIQQLAASMEKTLAGLAASDLSGPESVDPASDSSQGAGFESGQEL